MRMVYRRLHHCWTKTTSSSNNVINRVQVISFKGGAGTPTSPIVEALSAVEGTKALQHQIELKPVADVAKVNWSAAGCFDFAVFVLSKRCLWLLHTRLWSSLGNNVVFQTVNVYFLQNNSAVRSMCRESLVIVSKSMLNSQRKYPF